MSKAKYVLKWTNKFSQETGYVKSVRKTKGYFENTWERDEAKTYANIGLAERDILTLTEIGEAENNLFSIEEK